MMTWRRGTFDAIEYFEQSFAFWRDHNGCTDEAEATYQNGVFTCWTHDECDAGVEVTHCVGEGVDHCWPSPAQPLLPCNEDLPTTDLMWDFFERFALPTE